MYTLSTFLVGHELRLSETQILASGSVAFDTVHFDFDDNWEGLSKVALFWGADGNAYGSMVDAEGNAAVPWEALADAGRIKFGVYGVTGSGDNAVRATSTLIHYKLPEGAWTEDGQQPTPAEQTIIEQAIAAIQSAVENLDREPIIRNGIWYTWDINVDDYVSTGEPATGPAAGFGTVSATVDGNVGTPSVEVSASGPDTAKNFSFSFHNIKGAPGAVTGVKGDAESTYRSGDVNITKANIGLGNVDNTSDINKPVSTAQQAALDNKVNVSDIANDLTTTTAGKVLGARQGKVLNDSIAQQAANIGIVETGSTCTHTGGIPAGAFVMWQGVIYTADAAISVGETLAASGGSKNLTACPNGGFNEVVKKSNFGWTSLGTQEGAGRQVISYNANSYNELLLLLQQTQSNIIVSSITFPSSSSSSPARAIYRTDDNSIRYAEFIRYDGTLSVSDDGYLGILYAR